MPRGRKGLSPEQEKLRGAASRARRAPAEALSEAPAAPTATLAAPAWLAVDETAAGFWRNEAVPILRQLAFIRATDHHALARWCYWMAQFLAAARTLSVEGTTQTVPTVGGEPMIRRHPATKDRTEAEMALERLEDRLGLNPKRRYEIMANLSNSTARTPIEDAAAAQDGTGEDDQPDGVPPLVDFLDIARAAGSA